ncbi:MAG: hypothetical protein QE487_01810 [Fluviicola sp.]|nr:hypothetical protein [Fluviicola sp.]
MKRKLINLLLASLVVTGISAQEAKPTQTLGFNIGMNQFDKGFVFGEIDWSRESSKHLYRLYNNKLAFGYSPWNKGTIVEAKSYISFLRLFSVGGSAGYFFSGNTSANTLIIKPQIGLNFLIASIYYGYNYQFNPNPNIVTHNITLSIFIGGINEIESQQSREFLWWGNLFKSD